MTNLTPMQERYKAYFQALIDELRETHRFTGRRTGRPENWCRFSSRNCFSPAGIKGISYGAQFAQSGKALTHVHIHENVPSNRLDLFDALEQRKEEIESESDFDSPLEWERREGNSPSQHRRSRVTVSRDGNIWLPDDELEGIREWHIENLLKLKTVFQSYIQQALETLA